MRHIVPLRELAEPLYVQTAAMHISLLPAHLADKDDHADEDVDPHAYTHKDADEVGYWDCDSHEDFQAQGLIWRWHNEQ